MDTKIIVWKYNEWLAEKLRKQWYKEIYKYWKDVDNWEVNLYEYNLYLSDSVLDVKKYYIPSWGKLFIIWDNLDREIIKKYLNINNEWYYLEWVDNKDSPYVNDIILSENNNIELLTKIILNEWKI